MIRIVLNQERFMQDLLQLVIRDALLHHSLMSVDSNPYVVAARLLSQADDDGGCIVDIPSIHAIGA